MCEAASPSLSSQNENTSADEEERSILHDTISLLLRYGFIADAEKIISLFYEKLAQGYPVPYLQRDEHLAIIQSYLINNGVYSRGRFGGWKYEVSNQDHSLMQGVEAIDRIISGIPEVTYYYPDWVNSGRKIGRYPLIGQRECPYVFVIAHYKEDLSWLKARGIAQYSHVFHKGGDNKPNFDVWRWERLPNIGHEAHTYLHYIIENYHRLPEIVIFLQGKLDDHIAVHHNPWQYYYIAHKTGRCFACSAQYSNWGRIIHNEPYITELRNGIMKLSPYNFAQFWQVLFESNSHPRDILQNYHGCFAIKRERILARPKIFYQKAIKLVSDHVNPENGHYFERTWLSIFT